MSAHTVFLLAWLSGMATALALAYVDHPGLAFFVLVICAGLRSIES